MNQILKIKSLSIHSSLGKGANFNASAMHCGYDGFIETTFKQAYSSELQLGAIASQKNTQRGFEKLVYLCTSIIQESIEKLNLDVRTLPIYFCLENTDRATYFTIENTIENNFLNNIKINLNKDSKVYFQGRCGFTSALKQAQIDIYGNHYKDILIIGVDSLLNSATLAYYGGDLYGNGCRLLTDNNSNGFIPGEASTAILLSKPTGEENEIIISGVGTSKESATIYNEDELLRAKGLSTAIMEASKQAKLPIHKTGFRVGSMSGEEYFFDEATLAQQKTLKQLIPDHPLWHPADCIGEVGAAIGGAMVIQTYYAMLEDYAPGDNAICHISNDDEPRGAFIMQHTNINRNIDDHKDENLEGMYFSDIIKKQLKHDAPYAWFLMDTSSRSPLFYKMELKRLEDRLESYVQCFILSERADDSLLDSLDLSDWGAIYVMARVALYSDNNEAFSQAVEAIKEREQIKELSQALSLYPYKKIENKLQKLIIHKNPLVRIASIQALTILKIQLEAKLVKKLLADKDIGVKIEVIKLIGSHKLTAYQKDIAEYLKSENEELRFETAYAGSILQSKNSLYTLQEFCFNQTPYLRKALTLVYHLLDDSNVYKLFQKVATREFSPRIKAYNLAMAGFVVESIPMLLEEIKNFEHSLFAAEAISFMTGVNLEDEDLAREENLSEEEERILLEDQKADEETQDYEDDLALPDVKLLTNWWKEHKREYRDQTRYLAGKTINEENLKEIIEKGTQAQITVAKLILRLQYAQNIELSSNMFSLEIEKKTEARNINKVAYALKTGNYQATLPKEHSQAKSLKVEPFAYNSFKEGEAFNYFGLEDFEVEKIVWILIHT